VKSFRQILREVIAEVAPKATKDYDPAAVEGDLRDALAHLPAQVLGMLGIDLEAAEQDRVRLAGLQREHDEARRIFVKSGASTAGEHLFGKRPRGRLPRQLLPAAIELLYAIHPHRRYEGPGKLPRRALTPRAALEQVHEMFDLGESLNGSRLQLYRWFSALDTEEWFEKDDLQDDGTPRPGAKATTRLEVLEGFGFTPEEIAEHGLARRVC
jgi:hypothetical protein